MTDRRWDALGRRYLSLGIGEICAALVFTVIGAAQITPRLTEPGERAAFWSALVPLLVVLLQAAAYWLLARRWIGRSAMPAGIARAYRLFRIADPVLIAAGGLGVMTNWPDAVGLAVIVVAVWVFAILEYINYFVVRLSYPPRRWFSEVTRARPSRISRDLRTDGCDGDATRRDQARRG